MDKKQEEKNWMDEFEDDFYFIRGAVDLARGCSSQEGTGVSDGSVVAVLEEAVNKLDDLQSLIDRVFKSTFEIEKLTPEQEKKRKMFEDLKEREIIQAVGRIGDKFDKKMKVFERR